MAQPLTSPSLPIIGQPRPPRPVEAPEVRPSPGPTRRLSHRERAIALAVAEATMPGHGVLAAAGSSTIERFERFLDDGGEALHEAMRVALWAAEMSSVPTRGRPLSMLPLEQREAHLAAWSVADRKELRWAIRALLMPLKQAYFDDPRVLALLRVPERTPPPRVEEAPRWLSQVTDGRQVEQDLELSCEVVVIGTGAGGGAAAYELARRGRAVLMLEAGDFFRRSSFTTRPSDALRTMYDGQGLTFSLGNTPILIPTGRAVGGTTVINSGTCFRTPDKTLRSWQEQFGLTMLTSASLSPYFDRVESMLGVGVGSPAYLGNVASIIARGAEAMHLEHGPLARNAPGCDGQGACCYGCPTGAKRSTDVSYVPEALLRGAQLVTGASVQRVEVSQGKARGLVARLASGRTLTVKADVVIVASGTLRTPLLLEKSGIALSSGQLGHNLSIHPAASVFADFDEHVDMHRGIPQSYSIDEFADEGLMFEGASTPPDVAAVAVPFVGDRFMQLMARYPHLATFGFMIKDTSRGSVTAGPGGRPLVRYDLNDRDNRLIRRGFQILSEVFFQAGARRVFPFVQGCEELTARSDIERLSRIAFRPGDYDLSAYHPLGTCRMGTDARSSCVGPDGEVHDTEGVFVADGSVVPSSLGVNPQITIMALALRTAEHVDARLDSEQRRPRPASQPRSTALLFDETMAGPLRTTDDPATERKLTLRLRAFAEDVDRFKGTRRVELAGTVDIDGLATAAPLQGTLGMDVLRTRRIPYDITFTLDDGRRARLRGKKSVKLLSLLETMTTLPLTLLDEEGRELARATVYFDAKNDLISFLKSFRLEETAST